MPIKNKSKKNNSITEWEEDTFLGTIEEQTMNDQDIEADQIGFDQLDDIVEEVIYE